jgi:hypothetical protein
LNSWLAWFLISPEPGCGIIGDRLDFRAHDKSLSGARQLDCRFEWNRSQSLLQQPEAPCCGVVEQVDQFDMFDHSHPHSGERGIAA